MLTFLRNLCGFLLLLLAAGACRMSAGDFLAPEEREWIQQREGRLEVLFGYEAPPNAYHDDAGEYVGLLVDFLREIENKVGIDFVFREFATWTELIEYSKTNHNFIIVGIARTDNRAEYLSFTDPFVKVPYIVVTRENSSLTDVRNLSGSTACTVADYAINDYLRQHYPDILLRPVKDNLEGLRAVSAGGCRAMIVNQMYASHLVDKQGITNLKFAGESGYLNRLSVAVSTTDKELYTILDKAVDQITPERQQELYRRWVRGNSFGLSRSMRTLLWSAAGGAVILFAFLWFWSMELKKQVAKQTRQIRLSEEKFRSYVENAPVGIFVVDRTGMFLETNEAVEKITGYSSEELLEMKFSDLFASGLSNDLNNYVKSVIQIGSGSDELTGKKKGGEERFWAVITVKLSGERFLCFVADVTERRKSEEERVLLEEQYHQAQKVESIGRLAGGVSHDLNNLLTPIIGYGELLYDEFKVGDVRLEFVDEILKAGLRAKALVGQLLAFSRKQTLEYRAVNMNEALSGFVKLLRRTIREDIEIDIVKSDDIPFIFADVGQIEQVIMNLAVNGQDAMPEGGRLSIETALVDLDEAYTAAHQGVEAGRYVMLAVSDTGCGIDEETQKKLFEPFFSTKGEFGTGLGLATVYGIVKQHGGHIWVYSELGQGTTFKIYLPPYEQEKDDLAADKRSPVDLQGDETILLVEDNTQVRRLTHSILEMQGYTTLVAENGKQALDVLSSYEDDVHLLLTDVIMPEMNGRDLFLAATKIRPEMKILYMSGYTDDVIAHHGVLNEGTPFISKPFTLQTLSEKVREQLDNG